MESQGIERPDDQALGAEVRESVAEERDKARAKLAELEILHRKALEDIFDPVERERTELEYRAERRRIEERTERAVEALRSSR